MCIETFDYLMNLEVEQLQDEISSIDGNEILELFELVLNVTTEKLNEYKQDEKSLLKELTSKSLLSQSTIIELQVTKCNIVLSLMADELCNRLVSNISEQVGEYIELKKAIVTDVLKPFSEMLYKHNLDKLDILLNSKILENINEMCAKFNNIEKIIEYDSNNIYNSGNIKKMLDFEFNDNEDNENHNITLLNSKIKDNLTDSLTIMQDIAIGGLTGGEQGALNALCSNSAKILDTSTKLVKNTYQKLNEQANADKQSNIRYFENVLKYAKLIINAFCIDASKIFTNFDNNTNLLTDLKNKAILELKDIESLILKSGINYNDHIVVLKQVSETMQEILSILNINVVETI